MYPTIQSQRGSRLSVCLHILPPTAYCFLFPKQKFVVLLKAMAQYDVKCCIEVRQTLLQTFQKEVPKNLQAVNFDPFLVFKVSFFALAWVELLQCRKWDDGWL
jgi:hypothetical protein